MDNNNEEKLLEALRSNWEHARHIENLRLQMASGYIFAMLGAGAAVFEVEQIVFQYFGAIIGLLISVFCFGMTMKWNDAFDNQIKKADKCAKILRLSDINNNMHDFMGFPIRKKYYEWLNVRLMYVLFYLSFIFIWISIISYFTWK